jgi:hypothetical protein
MVGLTIQDGALLLCYGYSSDRTGMADVCNRAPGLWTNPLEECVANRQRPIYCEVGCLSNEEQIPTTQLRRASHRGVTWSGLPPNLDFDRPQRHTSALSRHCTGSQRAMTHNLNRGWMLRVACALLSAGAITGSVTAPAFAQAQEKKPEAKDQKKADAKPQAQEKKPEAKDQKKADAKPAPVVPVPQSADDPAKLKEQITALQKEIATLKLKVVTLELEKLGAIVTIDKAKDGKETATVNILKKWSGDKEALQLLKNVPNLQVVYIDNGQVNDAAVAPLKELTGLSALTLMSPQVTDAGLDNLKGLTNLTMLFLTSSKVGDKGLPSLKGLKNLQVLALSRTQVTDVGLDSLKDLKSLKSIYLIGTKVTQQAVDKLKETLPGVAVYK